MSAQTRYETAGRAVYAYITASAGASNILAHAPDAQAAVERARAEVVENYRAARGYWAEGLYDVAADLMETTATLALRLDQTMRAYRERVPAILAYLDSEPMRRALDALREVGKFAGDAAAGAVRGAAISAGAVIGAVLVLGALYSVKR